MAELSVTDTKKTTEDLEIGRQILGLIGSLNAVSLEIDRGFVFIEDRAVSLRNVVVGRRKRGTVDIALNGNGSYDITVFRQPRAESERPLYAWTDLASGEVREKLHRLWTYTA